MSDEKRLPTSEEVVRDRPRSPQGSLAAEGGPLPAATETEQRVRGGTIESPPSSPGHEASAAMSAAAGSLGGEDMGPDERDDLREEDVTGDDRLSEDTREADPPVAGQPLPGGAQGEDMLPSERIDGQDD